MVVIKTVKKIDALPPIPHRLRVAAYARVSSAKESMLHSMSAQVSYYNALIQRHIEWVFAGVYADEAVTGTKDNRKEFQRLLTDCRAGKVDMIITKSVTRFARNTVTALEAIRELKLLGIDVYFERENIHSLSGDGELMLSILASYAQEESRSASENCKWRIRRMFQEGRTNNGNILGYRLINGKFYIMPSEAETVRQIFTDYLSGMGRAAIAQKLNAAGVSKKNGKLWRGSGITIILSNEKYTGNMLLQKTYTADHITKKKKMNRGELPMYRIENSHEAIIDPATFKLVQAEMARRAEKYRSPQAEPSTYPFTGMVICGICGARYTRKHAISGKYMKIVWICNTFNSLGKGFCASQQIPESILMEKAAEVLELPAFDPTVFADRVAEIRVPAHYRLTFVFKDGHAVDTEWQYPSRRVVWTEEKKQRARAYEMARQQRNKMNTKFNEEEDSS